MKISMNLKNSISRIISITLFATILTFIVSMLLRFKVGNLEIFIIEIISIMVLYMLKNQRRIFVTILVSIIFVVGIYLYIQKISLWEQIRCVGNWFVDFLNGKEPLHKNYVRVILVGMQLITLLLTRCLFKNKLVRYISSFLALLLIVILAVFHYNPSKLLVGFALLLSLIMLVEIRCNSINASQEKKETAIFHLIPICLMIVFIVVWIPSRTEPVKWTGVRHAITSLKERGEMLWAQIKLYAEGKDGSYEMSLAGYDDGDTELGGSVEFSNDTTLKLKTSTTEYPGYLTGNVKNVYTGSGWKTQLTKPESNTPEYTNDFYELVCALSRVDRERLEESNIIKLENYEIVYDNIKTITQFYPIKTYQFVQGASNRVETDKLPNITFQSLKGEKTNYVLYYYILNLDSSVLKDILRSSDNFQYDEYITSYDEQQVLESVNDVVNLKSINRNILTKSYIEELKQRQALIYTEYTQLPQNLPQRVVDLAKELTKDEQNNYDKMKAIESYLNSFSYTTKALPIDTKKDFVDSFLFESKQGYCTYFASAMAVLGRCIGIPTRYVEGFYVDYKEKSDGYYKVNNSDAHAWIEAYFDGVGWIPFEPTPGYVEKRYKEWIPSNKTVSSSQEAYDYSDQYKHVESSDNISKETDGSKQQEKSINLHYVAIFIGILASMFTLATIYYSCIAIKMKKLYGKSNQSVKAIALYRKIMFYLEYIGYPYDCTETLRTYTTRMDEEVDLGTYSLIHINDLYMAIHYGDYDITEEELSEIIRYEQELHHYLVKKYGSIKMRRCIRRLTINYKKLFV